MTLPDNYGSSVSQETYGFLTHFPGEINVIADHTSRVFDDLTEWKPNVDAFNRMVNTLGAPDIDILTSRLNYQLTPYVS